jgi:hypothetical protein
MKTSRFFSIALVGLLIGFSISSNGALFNFNNKLNKTFQKEFKVHKGTQLTIENRFGQVNIENWDKNSVSIEVEVTVEHTSRDRAERMLAAINVILEESGNEIRAITEIDEKLMKSFGSFNFSSSSKEFRIDYRVKMPSNVDISLKNKFGDIFIDQLTGHSRIELKYGNLKANRIYYGSAENLSFLDLGYGNASIDEVNWMKFDVKYANVTIVKAVAVVMLSKYSKFSVDQVSSIVTESKYDTFTIGRIANIVGESGYTTYRINRLDKKLDITTKYGDVRLAEVANNFESITFNGSYASLYAPIDQAVSYTIDGQSSYGGISYNTPARVNRIESSNKLTVNGTVGDNPNASPKVIVNVRYGSAKLR